MEYKEIKLLKNNDKRDWDDEQWMNEFYYFLQGQLPDGIKTQLLNLTPSQAYTIIWYLQEKLPVFPDNICQCDNCLDLYNDSNSGYYSEKGNEIGNSFCGACEHLAPYEEEDLVE